MGPDQQGNNTIRALLISLIMILLNLTINGCAGKETIEPHSPVAYEIPREDGPLTEAVNRGKSLFTDSGAFGSKNGKSCSSCHSIERGKLNLLPDNTSQGSQIYPNLSETYLHFPSPRESGGEVKTVLISQVINDCIEKQMAGTQLPIDSPEMLSLESFLAWLSRGGRISVGAGNNLAGMNCVRCHEEGGPPSEDKRSIVGTILKTLKDAIAGFPESKIDSRGGE